MTTSRIRVSRSEGARQPENQVPAPGFESVRDPGASRLLLDSAPTAFRLALVALVFPIAAAPLGVAADQPSAARSRIVDPAVVPAGAMTCKNCGPTCRGHGGSLHGHHHGCREGNCVPYCPVRPDRYGYYGTQWRKWPGQQIVQVSNDQALTPVKPPRSAVPGPNEESIGPQTDDLPAPAPQAATPLTAPAPDLLPSRPAETQPLPETPSPDARLPEPPVPVTPETAPAPVPAPNPAPAAKPTPAPTPTKPRPEDENLFEADAGWKAKRKFAVARHDSDVKPAGHSSKAGSRLVPRVPFDAPAESRQVRAAGGR
jgi:hypothetical protein